MRLWSEERRLGTMELLLTMPVTTWQAIVGKFLASWLFLILALAFTFPVWITVNWLGNPDNGVIVAATSAARCCGRLSRDQLHDFGDDAQSGDQLHRVGDDLPVPDLAGFTPVTDLLVRWAQPVLVQTIARLAS